MICLVDIDWTLINLTQTAIENKHKFKHKIDFRNPYNLFILKEGETVEDLYPDIKTLEILGLKSRYVRRDVINYIISFCDDLTRVYLFTKRMVVDTTRFRIFEKLDQYIKGSIQTLSDSGKLEFLKNFSHIDERILWFDDKPYTTEYQGLDVEIYKIPFPGTYHDLSESVEEFII